MKKNIIFALTISLLAILVFGCRKKPTEPSHQNTVQIPTFNPPGGDYTSQQSVTINCVTSGATIRYTTNGIDPTEASTPYAVAITVSATTTLKAKAFKSGWTPSSVASAIYTIGVTPGQMIYVPAGTFIMGDTRGLGRIDELPTHSVTLNAFYIGKCEVTQAEWQAVMGSNPAHDSGVGSNYPVYFVS